MAHTFDVGTRAWQPDATEGWIASEVESKNIEGDKVKLVFQLANGEVSCPPNEWPPLDMAHADRNSQNQYKQLWLHFKMITTPLFLPS